MKRILTTLACLATLCFSACQKEAANPTAIKPASYGKAVLGSDSVSIYKVVEHRSNGAYSLMAMGTIGLDSVGISFGMQARPSMNQTLLVGKGISTILVNQKGNGLTNIRESYFGRTNDVVNITVEKGVVTYTFQNLSEISVGGSPSASRRILAGSLRTK